MSLYWRWFASSDFMGNWTTVGGIASLDIDDENTISGLMYIGEEPGDDAVHAEFSACAKEDETISMTIYSRREGVPPLEVSGHLYCHHNDVQFRCRFILTDGSTVIGITRHEQFAVA